MPLRDVARAAGITIGKAHPYLVSFCKVGFVVQDDAGSYEIGPLALQLGLVRLQRMDSVKEAGPLVEALALETGMSISVAIWGNLGPTVIRLEQPSRPLHIAVRVGTVMSVPNTATGRLFAAYLSPGETVSLIAQDALTYGGRPEDNKTSSVQDMQQLLAQVRSREMSRTVDHPIPGITALAAPVFNATGNLVLAVTVIGHSAVFDASWDGEIAASLRRCVTRISSNLGFHGMPARGSEATPV